MASTIHPWTMYEVARFRDEERLLRAQAAMRALKTGEEHSSEPQPDSLQGTISWLGRIRHRPSPSKWARIHHPRPHHVRHI